MSQIVVPPAAMVPPGVPFDPEAQARVMYWLGWRQADIARMLDIPESTVKSWKTRQNWDDAEPVERAAACTYVQYMRLVMKPAYTPSDVRDIDLLGRQIVNFARVEKFKKPGGNTADLNPNIRERNKGEKKKPVRNRIDRAGLAKIKAVFEGRLYAYQRDWMNTTTLRTRMLVKSRQIGATYYFGPERLIRAVELGYNQIFISASRSQANIFRTYINNLVLEVLGVQLSGDPLVIDRGEDEDGNPLTPVTLYFLGTNYRTAQGYSGDVIIDECFWIYGFEEIYKVASAIATHQQFTRTLFSTPSSISHQAYPMWTGERYNKKRPKDKRVRIPTSHEALKNGHQGGDNIYRQIVTIHDAIEKGFDKVNLDELIDEYGVDEFRNLFECEFVDDATSSFPLQLIQRAMVDSWEVWDDFDPWNDFCPYSGDVWIGYDPNNNDGQGDPAGLVVLAAPKTPGAKFRVLETRKLRGLDYQQQADEIRKLTKKYRNPATGVTNVRKIAIDTKGVGSAVYQLVAQFFPAAVGVMYDAAVKGLMVAKAQNVFRNRRIEFDQGKQGLELAGALMSIHPELTASGRYITYKSRRTAEIGHGDIAWALLNALYQEPIEVTDGTRVHTTTVEFSDD
jgi:uncharacterized protein YjcR